MMEWWAAVVVGLVVLLLAAAVNVALRARDRAREQLLALERGLAESTRDVDEIWERERRGWQREYGVLEAHAREGWDAAGRAVGERDAALARAAQAEANVALVLRYYGKEVARADAAAAELYQERLVAGGLERLLDVRMRGTA